MKVLSRYILSEFLSNLGLGLIIFTFVLLLDHLFELVDLLLNKGVGLWLTVKLLFFLVPSSLSLTLPVSVLLACLLTFGRLSENNEITAVRASGLAAWSYVKTPFVVAGFFVLFLVPFNTHWVPTAHGYFRSLYVQLLQRNPLVRIDEKTFVEVGEYHLYVEKKEKKSGLLRGITIYRYPAEGAPVRIFADRGKAIFDPSRGITLQLYDGRMEQGDAAQPDRWMQTGFKEYQFFIPQGGSQNVTERELKEMTTRELRREIALLKSKNLPHPIHSCELHLRWALSITPVLFAGLGIPLAIRMQRGGRSIGFGMSLVILVIYYVLLMGGTGLGQRGVLPAWLTVWFGNAVLLISSAALYLKMTKR